MKIRLDGLENGEFTIQDLLADPTVGHEGVEILRRMPELEILNVVPLAENMDEVASEINALHVTFPQAKIVVRFDGQLTLPAVFSITYELGLINRIWPDWVQWTDVDVANNDPVLFALCQKVVGAY